MSILLAAATEAEIAPTLAWLDGLEPGSSIKRQISVCVTGVGLMASTFELTRELISKPAELVVGAGIAGAFNRDIQLAECVIVRSEQLADFGAEDGPEFIDIFGMGLVKGDEAPFSGGKLINALGKLPPVLSTLRQVDSLTVTRVSGHEPTIADRNARYTADIEGMEGAALHYVCGKLEVPYIQLRSISNYVTRRDRNAWKTGEAIGALNTQLQEWLKTLS
jgi:futalosine hydrolase